MYASLIPISIALAIANDAGVAQLVELLTCNEEAARSIRAASFDKFWAGTQVANPSSFASLITADPP